MKSLHIRQKMRILCKTKLKTVPKAVSNRSFGHLPLRRLPFSAEQKRNIRFRVFTLHFFNTKQTIKVMKKLFLTLSVLALFSCSQETVMETNFT